MRPVSHSRSAIAILMQATAVEPPAEGVFDAGFGDAQVRALLFDDLGAGYQGRALLDRLDDRFQDLILTDSLCS